MALINRGSFAKALWPGVKGWYGRDYDEWKTEWTDLFDTDTSRQAYEEMVSISSFGQAVKKPEGEGISYDSEKQGFITRYVHDVWALGFIITREMVDDDLYDVIGKRRAQGLAFSMRQTKETNAANVYNRAFSNTYLGGDGLEMCSTAHVNIAGGTYQNELTTAADISEASLEQACIDIGKWTNDRGLKINVHPQSLIIPIDLEFEVHRILKSAYRVGTADNDVNALNQLSKFPQGVKLNHYLSDADAWFIRTNCPRGPTHLIRRPASFAVDNDFDTENAKFKATERYVFGWTDPRGIYGSPGA